MPNIIEITDFNAPELDVYARLTEAQLLNRFEPAKGIPSGRPICILLWQILRL